MVMPNNRKTIYNTFARVQNLSVMFLLNTVSYLLISEIRVYKRGTVVYLHCLSCRNVTKHQTPFSMFIGTTCIGTFEWTLLILDA